MDNQKEYLFVFRNMKYTNNQKLELLNKLISGHPPTNELIQYYVDRAQIYYDMEQYQSAIDDINDMEYLEEIPDHIKVLKWKSIIHVNFSILREEVKSSLLLKGHHPFQMGFMQRISDANVTKFLEDNEKSCKRKRKED